VADSQRSAVSNPSSPKRTLHEYRSLDRTTKHKRQRRKQSDSDLSGQWGNWTGERGPDRASKCTEDVSEDEVHLIRPQKTSEVLDEPKRKRPEPRPITAYSDRFNGIGIVTPSDAQKEFSNTIDRVERSRKRLNPDLSPDELAPSSEEGAELRPAKRAKHPSPSLSKRGNIKATNFRRSSTIERPVTLEKDHQRVMEQKRQADLIIGDGLRILRGISGVCQYEAGFVDDPDHCFLCVRQVGHTLLPVDQERNILRPYRNLTLSLHNSRYLLRAKDDKNCCIVSVVYDTADISNGAGPKLMIEFATTQDFAKFFQWAAVYNDDKFQFNIKDCPR
jgi:hypothetical protein